MSESTSDSSEQSAPDLNTSPLPYDPHVPALFAETEVFTNPDKQFKELTGKDYATVAHEDEELECAESKFSQLVLDAQTLLSAQPRSTQQKMTSETRALFNEYKMHGSMARLKTGLQAWYSGCDEDRRLRITTPSPCRRPSKLSQEDKNAARFGKAFMLNNTSADDDYDEPDSAPSFPSIPPQNPTPAPIKSHPLRIIDSSCASYVTTLPWSPVFVNLKWDETTPWPAAMIASLNRILTLEDVGARNRLFHHVSKYGPSPLFRLGITEYLHTHYGTMFETGAQHDLLLAPPTRAFLRSVYDKRQTLNAAERRLLAQGCRVDEGTLDLFWEEMNEEQKGFQAMCVFMAAREIEAGRRAEAEEQEEWGRNRGARHERIPRGKKQRVGAGKAYYGGATKESLVMKMPGRKVGR